MQVVRALVGKKLVVHQLPDPAEALWPGLLWGAHDETLTPAYWAAQAWMWEQEAPDHYRLGRSLEEETLACLLGGHGIPAEVGLAAYARLRPLITVAPSPLTSAEGVQKLLAEPLVIEGRLIRYRFARQKATYVALAMQELPFIDRRLGGRALRNRLTAIKGIGLKTASWIVRNWQASDDVAILDVHILRIGRILGVFPPHLQVERHYQELEDRFLAFAEALGVKASTLDSVMWMTMRRLPSWALAAAQRPAPAALLSQAETTMFA